MTDDKFDRLYLYVQKWCMFFCSLCLQHKKFCGVAPSLLASAVLLMARHYLRLTPVWRPELVDLTTHAEAELTATAALILDLFKTEFPQFFHEGPAYARGASAT